MTQTSSTQSITNSWSFAGQEFQLEFLSQMVCVNVRAWKIKLAQMLFVQFVAWTVNWDRLEE